MIIKGIGKKTCIIWCVFFFNWMQCLTAFIKRFWFFMKKSGLTNYIESLYDDSSILWVMLSRERASPASQKSADSRHSHSKSSKRSSRSPADSRREGGNGAAQDSASPSFKKSPHKRSQSPAASPLSANQDRGTLNSKDKDGGASGGDAGRSRKKEEVKGGDSVVSSFVGFPHLGK